MSPLSFGDRVSSFAHFAEDPTRLANNEGEAREQAVKFRQAA